MAKDIIGYPPLNTEPMWDEAGYTVRPYIASKSTPLVCQGT